MSVDIAGPVSDCKGRCWGSTYSGTLCCMSGAFSLLQLSGFNPEIRENSSLSLDVLK